ncbi:sigma-70 family RNA polymerase sigma factor [Clostridium paridis]|uniref:Sigma-70 family RNA polymerase sigma factor n=1 Tax=Clostridium paridis TaxID=2803863 RepID=A0A937FE55_9CLOT|nr:sigma-70 family RNA polymerase sigma factor [Clostridium paridis]MBL4932169.1 sigma-70 family RNA polymerase sigma factor [Clostridium paridis]
MEIDDNNLIQELARKNEKALDYLVERYGNLLFKVSYSVLNDRETSLECMNDSLLRIWNNIQSFRGDYKNFVSWIVVITKRIAIDEVRKKDRRATSTLEEFMVVDEISLEKQLEHKETRDRILKEIDTMEDITREIFLRRFFVEESIVDISKKLGMSVSAVSNRILRGKKKLEFLFSEEVV